MIRALARFLAHVDLDAVALTGGVAIDLHVPGARSAVADLDLVAATPAAIRDSVAADFLVSHHHQPPKWLLQLVDREDRLRLDVFADRSGSVARAAWHEVQGVRVRVLTRADILVHKLQTIAGPTERKHVDDVVRLGGTVPDGVVIRETEYCKDVSFRCERCRASPLPLADKREIFAILGYV